MCDYLLHGYVCCTCLRVSVSSRTLRLRVLIRVRSNPFVSFGFAQQSYLNNLLHGDG